MTFELMEIERIKEYTKSIEVSYYPCKVEDLVRLNNEFKHNLLFYSRIPNIISLQKKYRTFEIKLENLELEDFTNIILLKKSEEHKKAKITFNFDYFTAPEIFDIFKIPPISSFQIVGSLIHLNLKEEHEPFKNLIAVVLLAKYKQIKTIISKKNEVDGVHRTFEFDVLAGIRDFEVTHIENGIKFFIDYENVYWNGKLENERNYLVTNFFKENQVIFECTGGVGPLSLLALKNNCVVFHNDINPHAIKCLKRSLMLNKNINRSNLHVYHIDIKEFVSKAVQIRQPNHIVINLPSKTLTFIRGITEICNKCWIHAYFFCKDQDNVIDFVKNETDLDINVENIKFIRKVSPSKSTYKLTYFIERV